jgi:UDP-glucose 4-epimerase
MVTERILAEIAHASGQRYTILRYLSVAGADPDANISQASPGSQPDRGRL